jgi:glycosyltransferase involved in cell wall biosynthesis
MKIAFVDDLVHKKTGSTEFLVGILKKENKVKRFWGNGFKRFDNNGLKEINEWQPDLILFFQRIPNFFILKKFKCKKIVFVPMHDQEIYYSIVERKMIDISLFSTRLFFDLRLLCFSIKDFKYYKGYNRLDVKYYPEIKEQCVQNDKVYFWERENGFKEKDVRKLIGNKKLVVKKDNEWLSKKELESLISSCGIAIASRNSEGIGHGFLELMARGVCVIAFNEATHNEYIEHGKNGLLFKEFKKLDLSNWKQLGNNARNMIGKKQNRWKNNKRRVLEWLRQ